MQETSTSRGPHEHREPQLTEPTVVQDVFITGAAVEVADGYVRVVGWTQLPTVSGQMPERRISTRNVYPNAVFEDMVAQWRRGKSSRK